MNLNNGPSLGTYTFDFGNPGQIRWHFAKEDIVENAPEPVSYFFDDDSIARQCSEVLSPLMADVVDVAVAVHMADRLALRRGKDLLGPTIGWARNLRLQIPVRLPEVWLRESISIRLALVAVHDRRRMAACVCATFKVETFFGVAGTPVRVLARHAAPSEPIQRGP